MPYQKELESSLSRFTANLKHIMDKENLNQKQLAHALEISESTLSGYLNGKHPKYDFLIALKTQFPYISIDTLLFGDIQHSFATKNISFSERHSYIEKYYGTYYLYYIDTSFRNLLKRATNDEYSSVNLRYALLQVKKDPSNQDSSKAHCTAVFGLSTRSDIAKIKEQIAAENNLSTINIMSSIEKSNHLYTGTLCLTQEHVAIELQNELCDKALIIMHNITKISDYFFGGLGTINSISSGRDADPIVQRIAFSRNFAHISDAEIKQHLMFATPEINVKNSVVTKEILRLAKLLYSPNSANNGPATTPLSDENIEILLSSYIEYLVTSNLENNKLWFGRVSKANDDNWYHLLTASDKHYAQNSRR